jgi:flagellar hook protein FlgE
MSFGIALSGLNAAQADLNVTANNIANVDTTGFKSSTTEFSDLFAATQQGVSSTAIGNGVSVSEVAQQFTQGNIDSTGNNLDLAVSGNGFFTMSDNGALSYTRDGSFQEDSAGFVTDSSGARLQVYPPLANGGFNTGGLQDLNLTTNESAPKATTTVSLTANLPASATVPTNATFNPADATSYNDTTSLTTYDSLGAAHTSSLYFVKGATANNWTVQLYVDGNAVGTPQALDYSNTGALTTPAGGQITFPPYTPATGAAPMNLTFSFSNTTQDGSTFGVTANTQDGYTTGTLTGINIDSTGVVQARFTNGNSVNLGQVALANFPNPQGLQQLGDQSWAQTFASGAPVSGTPGQAGLGTIQSGALEESNVDITAQLVNMITAQRDFQANAQMVTTNDQITQTIINIQANG